MPLTPGSTTAPSATAGSGLLAKMKLWLMTRRANHAARKAWRFGAKKDHAAAAAAPTPVAPVTPKPPAAVVSPAMPTAAPKTPVVPAAAPPAAAPAAK
ncbi:hypothetical protein LTR86_000050 [Recurvomyces mirabilis]|nr:hypothetical protein LTR86_000050 [Recurvomyces mirabilis]